MDQEKNEKMDTTEEEKKPVPITKEES
jgi:hypothetical protein